MACKSLRGKAFAVQQHQDIIAVSYAARAVGVKKHMKPAEVGACLSQWSSAGMLKA